jgi:hypothetical protein
VKEETAETSGKDRREKGDKGSRDTEGIRRT